MKERERKRETKKKHTEKTKTINIIIIVSVAMLQRARFHNSDYMREEEGERRVGDKDGPKGHREEEAGVRVRVRVKKRQEGGE